MGHVPDHIPAAAATEHGVLIVALDADDLEGLERRRAEDLAGACPGCASLLADLAILRTATAQLSALPRTRDYRLTDADAERLRPSAWRQIIAWLGSPRSTVRPLAGGLAALGIVGLLLTTAPGIFGGSATSLSTAGAPVAAPSTGTSGGGSPEGSPVLGVAPNAAAGPGAAATAPPAASPAFAAPEATPRGAALPLPSLAAAALPSAASSAGAQTGQVAPTAAAGAGVVTGPAAPSAAPSTGSAATGAMDSGAKAGVPAASGGERNASLSPVTEAPAPDRTLPLLISLVLLAVGVALLLTNRMLRRRAGG